MFETKSFKIKSKNGWMVPSDLSEVTDKPPQKLNNDKFRQILLSESRKGKENPPKLFVEKNVMNHFVPTFWGHYEEFVRRHFSFFLE